MRHNRDPYWLTAKYAGKCSKCGAAIQKGERVFYYPNSRSIFSADCAETASRDFECAAADEAFGR